MIYEFNFKNFRSYKSSAGIDFTAKPIGEFKESLIIQKADNTELLPVCAIYGPNGGGKSSVLFALLALISHRKPAGHYVGLGSTLLAGLVVLIVMSVVNIFIQGTVFNIAVSPLGIIIFSAYILYDVSLLKYDIQSGGVTCRNDLSIHVLNLYLDFVNILLDLLRIVSELKD